jgi:hypothetical protein
VGTLAEDFNVNKVIWCACTRVLRGTYRVSADEVVILKLVLYKKDSKSLTD